MLLIALKLTNKLELINMEKEFIDFVKLLAEESGKIIKEYFRKPISIDTKSDESPVTIADKKAEETMRSLIMKTYPEHGIIGEEFGSDNEDAQYKWILDPIDGTKSFICGALTFGTLIALTKNNQPILGVFHQPILNELLIGNNYATEINGIKTQMRYCEKIEDAVLLTTDHLNVHKYQNGKKFEDLIRKVKLYRNWGDCYGYYLLATGFADIMLDPIMSRWDLTALIPIINGAGGKITDFKGNDAIFGTSILASSKNIHSSLIDMLN